MRKQTYYPILLIMNIYLNRFYKKNKESSDIYDADEVCDDLLSRLDVLNNISPSNYLDDDDEFSRFDSKTIGENDVIYGHIENSWISFYFDFPF